MKSDSEKHLLMIAHRIPYPPDKGDKIRSYNELRFLKEKGWQIHLCTFIDDPEDLKHAEVLKPECATSAFFRLGRIHQKIYMSLALLQKKPLSVGAFYKSGAQQYVETVLSKYPIHAVLCFSSPTAEYIFRSPLLSQHFNPTNPSNPKNPKNPSNPTNPSNPSNSSNPINPTLVMDLIDVDSDKWQQYAAQSGISRRWIYGLESRRLAQYEKRIVDNFDATAVVSDAEADLLRRRTRGGVKVHGVPNGVDTAYFHPAPEGKTEKRETSGCTLVFCGLMDYYPNVDGVMWFVKEVLPRIRGEMGEVRFNVVGARPTKEIKALESNPGVKVLGRVEDIRPYVWEAGISVAPIRIARGIQNKVLEAMAMGKPVVATQQAFEGIEAKPGEDLLVTEADPEAFAEAVVLLWNDMSLGKKMGLNARKAVVDRYSWETQLEKLNALLSSP